MSNKSNPEIGNTIVADGIGTNYHDRGAGDPVVLIHGSGPGVSAWANWRLIIPELAVSRRIVAPDIVGFGFTERPAHGQYTLDRWLAHLVGLLDALELERADFVGNSFGGALAIALAARHPQRVRRLVLMGSTGIEFPLTEGLSKVWGYRPSKQAMLELLHVFAHDPAFATDELAELRYRASIREGFQESYEAMFQEPLQACVSAIATPEDRIAAIAQPTLIVHGREDLVVPPENARRLFDLIPDAELHMFGACGHWTQIERAAAFARLVGDFLAR